MALGKRKREQQEMWVATTDLPRSPGHVFYQKLDALLAEAEFDEQMEHLCEPYYAATGPGRPGIPPGVSFRMLMVGYFEGLDSQRGIAWRCADRLSLREFLGVSPTEETPDHSSLTRIRQRLPLAVHEEMFVIVLSIADGQGLLRGKTVAVDATTLEANAALKAIIRHDTGDDWKEYLRKLIAEEEGNEDPTDDELRRLDRKRKNKRVSNAEWQSPTDPESRVIKIKDGRTRLGYKAEHAVDLDTELVLSARVYHGDRSDSDTVSHTLDGVIRNVIRAEGDANLQEVVLDKDYYATETLAALEFDEGLRTYVSEPKHKRRRWKGKPEEHPAAVYNNRRRTRGVRGRALHRKRSELVERSFAHVCNTGGARRTWLYGLEKINKRYLVHLAAHNLAVVMRKLLGFGKLRCLQLDGGLACLCYCYTISLWSRLIAHLRLVTPQAPYWSPNLTAAA